ncbi:MAG: hypothetical protein BWY88_01461 [Synergistetes bacterium ADurb.Bin520]|nr:MAG: hypothetical protein BWY88_01461 [Synergistetes bacterium ADurb.Bin520]
MARGHGRKGPGCGALRGAHPHLRRGAEDPGSPRDRAGERCGSPGPRHPRSPGTRGVRPRGPGGAAQGLSGRQGGLRRRPAGPRRGGIRPQGLAGRSGRSAERGAKGPGSVGLLAPGPRIRLRGAPRHLPGAGGPGGESPGGVPGPGGSPPGPGGGRHLRPHPAGSRGPPVGPGGKGTPRGGPTPTGPPGGVARVLRGSPGASEGYGRPGPPAGGNRAKSTAEGRDPEAEKGRAGSPPRPGGAPGRDGVPRHGAALPPGLGAEGDLPSPGARAGPTGGTSGGDRRAGR